LRKQKIVFLFIGGFSLVGALILAGLDAFNVLKTCSTTTSFTLTHSRLALSGLVRTCSDSPVLSGAPSFLGIVGFAFLVPTFVLLMPPGSKFSFRHFTIEVAEKLEGEVSRAKDEFEGLG